MEKSVLTLTVKELFQMTQEERDTVQRSLGMYIDTPDYQRARALNNMILDINHEKQGYGRW